MKDSKRTVFSAVGALALAVGVCGERSPGAVVISNFSAGVGTGTAFGSGSFTQHKTFGFTMGAEAYDLDEVVLTMNFSASTANIEVSIWSGASAPATKLITLDNPTLGGPGDFAFTPSAPFTLQAGESYWVYVDPVTVGAGPSYTWDGTSPSTQPSGPGATAIGYIFNGSPSTFRNRLEVRGTPAGAGCYPDCDENGQLNIDDFICFQLQFALQDPYADCDGNQVFNIDDFICFQLAFALGC